MSKNTAPQSSTRQHIIEAAGELFRKQGYARTTTRAIAAAAGITEVTLFRHFGTKENLFSAVVQKFANVESLTRIIEGQNSGSYHEDMLQIGTIFIKVLLDRGDSVRLMLCESVHFPEVREITAQNPKMLSVPLANYLRRQMKNDKIKKNNPDILAQSFLGMFFSYAIMNVILDSPIAPENTPDEITKEFVSIFVDGTISNHPES